MNQETKIILGLITLGLLLISISRLIKSPQQKIAAKISDDYYNTVKEFSTDFVQFISTLIGNKAFVAFFNKKTDSILHGLPNKINYFFTLDCAKCFSQISDLNDTASVEMYSLIYLFSVNDGYSKSDKTMMYEPGILRSFVNYFKNLKGNFVHIAEMGDGPFILANILNDFDRDLENQYLAKLHQFASIVANADGNVTPEEENVLASIIGTSTSKHSGEQFYKMDEKTLDAQLKELDDLTGLEGVKKEISLLINFIKIQKARESSGLKTSPISYHLVLTGNPGTGKTTVARIVARIYKNMGILAKGQLIESDRAGLIAEYEGQTAVKVDKVIDTAIDGVLFIDEAYSLLEKSDDSFGKEAIATLIKRMEDDRDKLVVILAGYTDEMKTFIDGNPGFKSRFNRYIDFADYSPQELVAIFVSQCNNQDYSVTDDAKTKLETIFNTAYSSRDRSFGNARFVRNVFEKSLELQANRLSSDTSLDKTELTTLTADDVPVM